MFNIHLYWYALKREDRKGNYGDILAPFLVSKLAQRKIIRVESIKKWKYNWLFKPYFTVGSIIKRANKNSIVWGSGIIHKEEYVCNANFLAVRGPLTRKRLIDLGYKVPEKFGDPAILLPKFIINNEEVKYEIGIIPHYVDYKKVIMVMKDIPNVKVINLITNNVEETTSEILQCKRIISSSLHGLIVPHAYKIPALWVKFSNELSGDNIKFYDYFESVGIIYKNEFSCQPNQLNFNVIIDILEKNKGILLPDFQLLKLRETQLLETCPF